MVVLIVRNIPPRIRGMLRLYLLEVSAGVFVGKLDARVREALWTTVSASVTTALMVSIGQNEQGLLVRRTEGWTERIPEDHEGVTLIRRPQTRKTR